MGTLHGCMWEGMEAAAWMLPTILNMPTHACTPAFLQSPLIQSYAPFRVSGRLTHQQGDPLDQPGLTSWQQNGYNYNDVRAYDSALAAILQLPGTAMDLRVADKLDPMQHINSALYALVGCSAPQVPRSAGRPADFAAAMGSMTSGLASVRDTMAGGPMAFREQLWGTTGFVPPALPPPPSPPAPPPLLP
ncbi:hypothetical protein HaLaN_21601, partial [Haematococcus lacustris]